MDASPAKKVSIGEICFICQSPGERTNWVKSPKLKSYSNVLYYARERFKYGETELQNIVSRLVDESAENMMANKISWHITCYKDICHPGVLNRSKARYEKIYGIW